MIQTAYKIVEVQNGDIRTLFHGTNGSRTIPKGEWVQAVMKEVKDGTSGTSYISGWHVLMDYQHCVEYLKRFKNRLDILEIVPCEVRNLRPKEHSLSPVFLAEYIRF